MVVLIMLMKRKDRSLHIILPYLRTIFVSYAHPTLEGYAPAGAQHEVSFGNTVGQIILFQQVQRLRNYQARAKDRFSGSNMRDSSQSDNRFSSILNAALLMGLVTTRPFTARQCLVTISLQYQGFLVKYQHCWLVYRHLSFILNH